MTVIGRYHLGIKNNLFKIYIEKEKKKNNGEMKTIFL